MDSELTLARHVTFNPVSCKLYLLWCPVSVAVVSKCQVNLIISEHGPGNHYDLLMGKLSVVYLCLMKHVDLIPEYRFNALLFDGYLVSKVTVKF